MSFYLLCSCLCECVSIFQLDKLEMSVSVRFSINSNFVEDKYVVCPYLSPDQTCLLFLDQPLLNWPRYYIWAVTATPMILKKQKKTERRPILIFPFFFVTYLIFPFRFLNLDLVFSVSTPGQWASYPSSGEHPAGWLTRLYLGQCLDRLFAPRPKRGVGVKGATGEKESFSALTDWKEVSISFASRSTCVYWFLSISLFFFFLLGISIQEQTHTLDFRNISVIINSYEGIVKNSQPSHVGI